MAEDPTIEFPESIHPFQFEQIEEGLQKVGHKLEDCHETADGGKKCTIGLKNDYGQYEGEKRVLEHRKVQ